MKLYERKRTDKTHHLPEIPPDVEVPDDISGLRPPTTLKPTTGGVRWMRWLVAIVVLGAVGVLTAVLISGDNAEVDDVVGSDRDPAVVEDLGLTPEPAIDYMEVYGTDNPVFVETETGVAATIFGPNEGPGSNSLGAPVPEAASPFGPNNGPGSNSLAP